MGVDLRFCKTEALQKGVVFKPIKDVVTNHIGGFECSMGMCECEYYSIKEVTLGYEVLCPDGSEGFAILPELFQCREINQEIKEWFLEHLQTAEISL